MENRQGQAGAGAGPSQEGRQGRQGRGTPIPKTVSLGAFRLYSILCPFSLSSLISIHPRHALCSGSLSPCLCLLYFPISLIIPVRLIQGTDSRGARARSA